MWIDEIREYYMSEYTQTRHEDERVCTWVTCGGGGKVSFRAYSPSYPYNTSRGLQEPDGRRRQAEGKSTNTEGGAAERCQRSSSAETSQIAFESRRVSRGQVAIASLSG